MHINGIWAPNLGHLGHGPHCNHVLRMVITSRQTWGMNAQLGCLVCCYIYITYYSTLLQIWGFQLNFVAEGDVGTLSVIVSPGSFWPLILTVIGSVPDVVWAQDSSTLGGRVKTKSSWWYAWNCLPGNAGPVSTAFAGVPHGSCAWSAMSSRCRYVFLP